MYSMRPLSYQILYPVSRNSRVGRKNASMVSTTRGVPSTSTNLKEAICEKIPLYYDFLRKFRSQYGPVVISRITVDDLYEGLTGVNAIVRETSEIHPKNGIKYRGLTIPEVIGLLPRRGKSPSPEAVFWLLMTGDIPTQEQTSSLITDWTSRRQRRKEWWSTNSDTGIVFSTLKGLPKSVQPLGKLSIALTILDANRYSRQSLKIGRFMQHTHWEYVYEDSMELLATLPAIVSFTGNQRDLKDVGESGDWIDFLLECLISGISEEQKNGINSVGDYLRLYVALNADEGGGVPGAHITQILGTSQLGINQALAAGALAYANEPKSGTMSQYMNFLTEAQRMLGREPTENVIKDYLRAYLKGEKAMIGYKETNHVDERFNILQDYARDGITDDPDIKLSLDMANTFLTIARNNNGNVCPEQSVIAGPLFKHYGLTDMQFNQTLLCMSRALGAVASIIWTKVINTPEEHPKSLSTYTYFEHVDENYKKYKSNHIKYIKQFPKQI